MVSSSASSSALFLHAEAAAASTGMQGASKAKLALPQRNVEASLLAAVPAFTFVSQ